MKGFGASVVEKLFFNVFRKRLSPDFSLLAYLLPRHKRFPATTTCGKAFIRATVFGERWMSRRYFQRISRKESCFHYRKQLSLTPGRAPTRLGIWVRGKNPDG
jgi:hypothetical protein